LLTQEQEERKIEAIEVKPVREEEQVSFKHREE